MTIRMHLLLAAMSAQAGFSANLAISTYFQDGRTPSAIASDPQGNVYIAGAAVISPASQASSAVVAKLNPNATEYVYLSYLDSAAADQISAIAVDSLGNAYVAGTPTNPNFPV